MIRIENLHFAVGNFALEDVCLHVHPGEYFVLLGPSGSGKTLLIESLCGLNRIRSGRILIGGTDVTGHEPRRRGIGYLPQDYALFAHRTVRRNVSFGLEKRGLAKQELREKVDHFLEMVGVAHLAARFPSKLSGGEKQRVALARALAVRPRVLVLDEPVSALDEQTRDTVCRQLKRLQRRSGATAIHVCHNFAEMAAVADRVGIIHQGRILQVGTPQEILQRPQSALVARFVLAGNLMPARVTSEARWLKLACPGGFELFAPRFDLADPAAQVTVMVRPENIRLATAAPPKNVPPGTAVLQGTVNQVIDLGPTVKVNVACGPDAELVVSLGKGEYNELRVGAGDRVALTITPESVHVMQQ